MEYKKQLDDFFSTCAGKVMNVFFVAYSIIDSLDEAEQPLAVMYLCENAFRIKSDSSNRINRDYYSEEQLEKAGERINEKFKPVLNSLIQYCSKENVQAIDFYTEVWRLINSSIFKSKRERALALFTLADYDLIPYRSVGIGMTMPNDQYQSIVDKLEQTILDDTEYILKLDYEQKTQRASLLVDRLLSLESKEEQAVYMAIIIHEIESNLRENIKAALDKV